MLLPFKSGVPKFQRLLSSVDDPVLPWLDEAALKLDMRKQEA